MEDRRRCHIGEYSSERAFLSYVAQDDRPLLKQSVAMKVQLESVKGALVVVQLEDLLGIERDQLTHYFAADRTAGSGDQKSLALHVGTRTSRVIHSRRAANKLLNLRYSTR
jgi:hypothetical protein